MDTASKKQTMLELLAENEVALARLYGAYAEKLPRQKDFWNTLAREEIRHSQWIQKLSTGTHVPVQIKEDRFDVAVFQISLDYLEEKLAQAKCQDLSHKDALATALGIETGRSWPSPESVVFTTNTGALPERPPISRSSL